MPLIARWTSKDLEALPQLEGVRYEIIDGELYVSTAPSWHHQYTCGVLFAALHTWSLTSGLGVAVPAPGVIFAPDHDVIPDVVWVSHSRFQGALDAAGHLTCAPELVVEVLSPGPTNERRDREEKVALYSRQAVEEYWIVDPLAQTIEVLGRQAGQLVPVEVLGPQDTLTSALLPGFRCPVQTLFRTP